MDLSKIKKVIDLSKIERIVTPDGVVKLKGNLEELIENLPEFEGVIEEVDPVEGTLYVGDIIGVDVFCGDENMIRNIHVRGNIFARACAFENAPFLEEEEGYILCYSENVSVKGDIIGVEILNGSWNSFVIGDVNAYFGVLSSNFSFIEGNVSGGGILYGAEKSYIIGDEVKAGSLGTKSKGCIVAAKEVKAKYISPKITVFTQRKDRKNTICYKGDWSDLEEIVQDKKLMDALTIFRIEKNEIEDKEELLSVTEGIKEFYNDVKEEIRIYKSMSGYLKKLVGKNELKVERLQHIRSEIKKIFSKKNHSLTSEPLNEESIDYILRSGNTYLIHNTDILDSTLSNEGFCLHPNEFIKIFTTDRRFEFVIGKGFSRLYSLSVDGDQEVVQGEELVGPAIASVINSAAEGKQFISEIYYGSFALNISISKEAYFEKLGIHSENLNNLNMDNVQQVLDQLGHVLKKPNLKNRARVLSSRIILDEKRLEADTLRLSIYDKHLDNVPTMKEYCCCTFLGGEFTTFVDLGESHGVFDYIFDPESQLMKIEIGDKTAMAIMAEVYNEDNQKILLIDSIESKSHIFNRRNIVTLVDIGLQEYAKENGFDGVFYAKNEWSNSSHREFLVNLDGDFETKVLNKKSKEVYLEANLGGEIEGYSRRLD